MVANRGPMDEQCPARGVGLLHTFDYSKHGYKCIECGTNFEVRMYSQERQGNQMPPGSWPPPPQTPMSWDIAGRFKKLGLGPPAPVEATPDTPVLDGSQEIVDELHPRGTLETEGKWITGEGPAGSRLDKGRADIVGQHRLRLERLYHQWMAGWRD